MRAIWKGHIRFSLVTIPVRIYSAIDSEKSIHFNQLNKETKNPVGYSKIDKVTKEELGKDDIVKGYQYEPGQYVIMEEEDFEKIKLKSTRVIDIEGFVDSSEVHPTLYDTPYFAGPDGEVAKKTYDLLMHALKKSGKVGVGKVVLRDKESVMLLTPRENGLLLYKLRYPHEVRDIKNVPQLNGQEEIEDQQLKLANTLIDSMTTSFNKLDLKDHYYEAVKEIVMSKVEGKEIVTISEEEPEVVDIMTALKESINKAKKGQEPMKKATGKKKKESTGKTRKTG